ncbi:MAG: GAF domain-containing protein [Verrucomicrobiaceae bacterium]|nr:GAF domain-containing protein [Verrucomicrobiaceae bacterium]
MATIIGTLCLAKVKLKTDAVVHYIKRTVRKTARLRLVNPTTTIHIRSRELLDVDMLGFKNKTSSQDDPPFEEAMSVLELVTRTETPSRRQYLEAARRVTGQDKASAYLWLRDEPKNRLNLDLVSLPESLPPELGRTFERQFASFCDAADQPPSDDSHPWPINVDVTVKKSIERNGECCFFSLAQNGDQANQPSVGFLQLSCPDPVKPAQMQVLRLLADGLTVVIDRSRKRRQLEAYKKIGKDINLQLEKGKLLHAVSLAVRDITKAQACIIFQHEKNLGVQAAASTIDLDLKQLVAGPGSIITRMLSSERTLVRLDNFHDAQERGRVLGTEEIDPNLSDLIESESGLNAKQLAWMAAPVLVQDHAMAVIVLYNKTQNLSAEFSESDAAILHLVCKFLADVIPGIETHQAMRAISQGFVPGSLDSEQHRQKLFELLCDLVPGITSTAVFQCKPNEPTLTCRLLGGEEWLEKTSVFAPETKPIAIAASIHGKKDKRWVWTFDIPPVQAQGEQESFCDTDTLRIALKRPYLSKYEEEIIAFFCAELGQELRAEASVQRELNNLLEVRHAIRSGLTGMSYIQTALAVFNRFQTTGEISELHRARFHRALDRAYMFYNKTRILLEESRFLVTEITPEKLRPGAHSVKELVGEVCTCLKPEAEKREVAINSLVSRLPHSVSDTFSMDRGLLEIAVFNLVDNAIKYSFREQQVSLRLELDREFWSLSVENIGVYIDPRDWGEIFKEFVRKPVGSRGAARPGTGLGLPVVEKIVKAHGGPHPTVESQLLSNRRDSPARTVFTIRIPRNLPLTTPING